jgi:hypothetical protein
MSPPIWDAEAVRRARVKSIVIQLIVTIVGFGTTIGVGVVLYNNALHTQLQEYRLKCYNRQEVLTNL